MSICEFYAGIYIRPLQSQVNNLQLQSMLDSALPEFYAAVIVFAAKAHTYFEARGKSVYRYKHGYHYIGILSQDQG